MKRGGPFVLLVVSTPEKNAPVSRSKNASLVVGFAFAALIALLAGRLGRLRRAHRHRGAEGLVELGGGQPARRTPARNFYHFRDTIQIRDTTD